jgi:hypothetical protein
MISASTPARTCASTKRCRKALDRHRQLHGFAHRSDAVPDPFGLGHQAGAETAFLDPIRGAAAIEVDFVVAVLSADRRGFGQGLGLAAAELQRHRVLGPVETEQVVAIAVQHRAGGEHFGVEAGRRRQQAMEIAAMAIGPVHHRRNAQPPAVPRRAG